MKKPKKLGDCADMLYALRGDKRKAEARVNEIKEEIQILEEHAIALMKRERTKRAQGARGQISIGSSLVPTVKDWAKVYKWILKTKDHGILERRVSVTHWRELLEAREFVPGVEPFDRVFLNITKAGEKAP